MTSPYDTGERLEPKPWYPTRSDPDTYGRVDFEGDAGDTEFTVCAKRDPEGDGFLLEIDNHGGMPIRVVMSE
jgi:hypothetical protein